MNKSDIRFVKKKILKCLTEDFDYGNKRNQAIFDKKDGFQNFHGTDLEMVMDKIMLGLYFAMEDSKEVCPHCSSENIEIYEYICKDCSHDFSRPKKEKQNVK